MSNTLTQCSRRAPRAAVSPMARVSRTPRGRQAQVVRRPTSESPTSGAESRCRTARAGLGGDRPPLHTPLQPWQNRKIERMDRTFVQKCQHGRASLEHYNWGRPLSAFGGLPPIVGVNNLLAHNS